MYICTHITLNLTFCWKDEYPVYTSVWKLQTHQISQAEILKQIESKGYTSFLCET